MVGAERLAVAGEKAENMGTCARRFMNWRENVGALCSDGFCSLSEVGGKASILNEEGCGWFELRMSPTFDGKTVHSLGTEVVGLLCVIECLAVAWSLHLG